MNVRRTNPSHVQRLGLGAGLVLAGVVLAACGSGSSGGTAASSPATSAGTSAAAGGSAAGGTASTVATASGAVGTYLATGSGRTLYEFAVDKGGMSACYDTCATYWPPLLTTGAPQASGGADAGKLGTTKRTDGTTQVTYGGFPLYTYAADSAAGDTKGQGLNVNGGLWWVLGVDGTPISGASSAGTSVAPASSASSVGTTVRKY